MRHDEALTSYVHLYTIKSGSVRSQIVVPHVTKSGVSSW